MLDITLSSVQFSRSVMFPSPGDLPDPGIVLGSPALQADALLSEPPRKPHTYGIYIRYSEYVYSVFKNRLTIFSGAKIE